MNTFVQRLYINTSIPPRFSSLLTSLVVLLSGFAGLGYQMVWTRTLSVALGHEIVSVLAVVAAFFVGLSLGGITLNRLLHSTMRPAFWYALLELLIGAWALLLVFLIPHFNDWVPQWLGEQPSPVWQWSVCFLAVLILLLPATAAMGATLPAIERLVAVAGRKNRIPTLYALNTLGAVGGTLLVTFFFIQQFGLSLTLVWLASVNFVCAFLVPLLAVKPGIEWQVRKLSLTKSRYTLLAVLFLSGLMGIGYEVVLVRLLSQILENTVYTFASALSVFLLGTAVGAGLYQKFRLNLEKRFVENVSPVLVLAILLSCATAMLCLYFCAPLYFVIWQGLGNNMSAAIVAELLVAALVFLLPTLFMGALFSHLALQARGRFGLGKAIAFNTLGSALAPLLFGVILLPMLGAKWVLLVLLAGYFVLGLGMVRNWRATTKVITVVAGCTVFGFALLPLQFRFLGLTEGDRLVSYNEGVMASVAVIEDAGANRHLKVNGHYTMGGTASRYSDHRQTHIPLLLHRKPQSVLYLGLGTGITLEAAQYYPAMAVTGVDLIPEVLPALTYFNADPEQVSWAKPATLLAADARRYVQASTQGFDVIVGEVFHPSRDGAGALYTREHFSAIKQRLNAGGHFCQWLPLFQLDMENLKTIVRTFVEVFAHVELYLGHLSLNQPIVCLLGAEQALPEQPDWLMERVQDRNLQMELVQMRLNSDFALFGNRLAKTETLKAFAGAGPINTDDFPVVNYRAPRFVYSSMEPPGQRLLMLVENLAAKKKYTEQGETEFSRRLAAYRRARDAFIRVGVQHPPGASMAVWAKAIAPPLLEIIATSKDFSPAYRTLLASAESAYKQDPKLAIEILRQLNTIAPAYPEARQLAWRLIGQ